MDFAYWVRRFEGAAAERGVTPDPAWGTGGPLPDALIASLQRFQAGEDGDGVSLLAKSARAGDADYLAAVRMFVAEEQRHARLLERILAEAGAETLAGHWDRHGLRRGASGVRAAAGADDVDGGRGGRVAVLPGTAGQRAEPAAERGGGADPRR
ncbi:hypothetical protein KRM28CT15_05000 [Krasilnikovia sp. M28-CT-15]